MDRVLNFYPGPAALPIDALKEARDEMLNWKNTGMSVMEISHRSKQYEEVHNGTQELLKKLFNLPDNFKILLLQGGASLQFAMIPMNLLKSGETADYIVTGRFSNNAYKNAKKVTNVNLACTTEEDGKYFRIPKENEIKVTEGAKYVHLTSNNTIFGTQWKKFPDYSPVPVIADMSSDILSRKLDFKPFGLIYAGAQKNLGPAGVTVVIIREDLIEGSRDDLPDMLSYKTLAGKNSLFNTPSCYGIYIMHKVLKWVDSHGGLDFIEKQNEEKANMVYGLIDKYPDFFISKVEKESRSNMNVSFRLPNEEMEKKFISEAENQGIIGLKGHRSVGGIRISMYNANGVKEVKTLIDYMEDFYKTNG